MTRRGHKGACRDARDDLYFDPRYDYTGIYICKNSSNDTLRFVCFKVIPQKKREKKPWFFSDCFEYLSSHLLEDYKETYICYFYLLRCGSIIFLLHITFLIFLTYLEIISDLQFPYTLSPASLNINHSTRPKPRN